MHAAKTRLSELVAAAERGEEVVIARNGVPAVRITTLAGGHRPVRLGRLEGQIHVHENFDDPLPEFAEYMQ